MNITFHNEDFLVIDDVLSTEDFAAFVMDAESLRYSFSNGRWSRVWQLSDPQAICSGSFYLSQSPIGFGMDKIVIAFEEAIKISNFYGAKNETWEDIAFRAYKQPRGSKLNYHFDSPQYVGAGVYYCHAQWQPLWGGDLVFPDLAPVDRLGDKEQKGMIEKIQRLSSGRFVSPKPNRLVLINGGVLHCTNRIDPDAGNNIRTSISAFLLHKKEVVSRTEDKINIGD